MAWKEVGSTQRAQSEGSPQSIPCPTGRTGEVGTSLSESLQELAPRGLSPEIHSPEGASWAVSVEGPSPRRPLGEPGCRAGRGAILGGCLGGHLLGREQVVQQGHGKLSCGEGCEHRVGRTRLQDGGVKWALGMGSRARPSWGGNVVCGEVCLGKFVRLLEGAARKW